MNTNCIAQVLLLVVMVISQPFAGTSGDTPVQNRRAIDEYSLFIGTNHSICAPTESDNGHWRPIVSIEQIRLKDGQRSIRSGLMKQYLSWTAATQWTTSTVSLANQAVSCNATLSKALDSLSTYPSADQWSLCGVNEGHTLACVTSFSMAGNVRCVYEIGIFVIDIARSRTTWQHNTCYFDVPTDFGGFVKGPESLAYLWLTDIDCGRRKLVRLRSDGTTDELSIADLELLSASHFGNAVATLKRLDSSKTSVAVMDPELKTSRWQRCLSDVTQPVPPRYLQLIWSLDDELVLLIEDEKEGGYAVVRALDAISGEDAGICKLPIGRVPKHTRIVTKKGHDSVASLLSVEYD